MFKGLSDFAQLLRQAQSMSARMQGVGEKLKGEQVTGRSGGGLIEVVLDGQGEAQQVRVDPQLFSGGDREMLEDLLVAALNDGLAKVRQLQTDAMKSAAGDMELPGMAEMLSRFTGQG